MKLLIKGRRICQVSKMEEKLDAKKEKSQLNLKIFSITNKTSKEIHQNKVSPFSKFCRQYILHNSPILCREKNRCNIFLMLKQNQTSVWMNQWAATPQRHISVEIPGSNYPQNYQLILAFDDAYKKDKKNREIFLVSEACFSVFLNFFFVWKFLCMSRCVRWWCAFYGWCQTDTYLPNDCFGSFLYNLKF